MQVPTAHSYRFTVSVGGTPVTFETDAREVLEWGSARYAGFIGPSSDPALTIHVSIAPPARACPEIEVRRNGQTWRITHADFEAELDPDRGRGAVRQLRDSPAIDSVLRIGYSLLLARRGGFLLHAASAVRNGRAFVFTGVSGAGKTTLSRLAPPDATMLTDEISHITLAAGDYAASGTPFFGELGRPGENVSAPIAGLFLLSNGPENRIDEVPPTEACQALMRNILFFAEDPEPVRALFAAACRFVTAVPVRRLTFRPEAAAWDLIR
jgi:hypothetical protein